MTRAIFLPWLWRYYRPLIFVFLMSSLFFGTKSLKDAFALDILFYSPFILCSFSYVLCLAMGKLDWSMGAIVGFAGIAHLTSTLETNNLYCGYLAGILVGIIVGAINGWMVGILKWPSLLATLGTMLVLNPTNQFLLQQEKLSRAVETYLNNHSNTTALPLALLIGWFGVLLVVLKFTKLKLYTIAIGEDHFQALRFSENPKVIIVLVYILQGMTAGLTGACVVGFQPRHGYASYETLPLLVLTAGLIGGMKLKGGGRPSLINLFYAIGIVLCLLTWWTHGIQLFLSP